MINITHPVSKYGLAVLFNNNNINSVDDLKPQMVVEELKNGIRNFRFQCISDPALSDSLTYQYLGLDDFKNDEKLIQSAGLSNQGKYLASNILSDEKSAKHTYNGLINLIEKIESGTVWEKPESFTMSVAPLSGKINNGKMSQGNPSGTLLEVSYSAIAATTPLKPYFSLDGENIAVIPDLEIDNLKEFVRFYKKMLDANIGALLNGRSKNGKYRRPLITKGNYPDAPYNPVFGAVGILAAIGKWSKEAGYDEEGEKVLDSLTEVPIYIIKYGNAQVVSFSHYLIEMAKENKLRKIVSALERTILLGDEPKTYDNPKYKLFYLFSSRFLQLFNESSFRDFLSCRAFYEPEVIHLFKAYFIKTMAIPKEIVSSARELGSWLNYVAYKAAEEGEGKNATPDQIRKAKAKFLVELESTAYSAKTADALIAQIITRAGRLSGRDAPADAKEFIEAVMNETITLEQSRHLVTAFSRLRNSFENPETTGADIEEISTELT